MAALKDARAVFERLLERHRGRIANTAGDGPDRRLPERGRGGAVRRRGADRARRPQRRARSHGRPMHFRIGVHLGDVMVDGGDMFGEGVNLAARLQGHGRARRRPHLAGGLRPGPHESCRSATSSWASAGPGTWREPVPVYRLLFDGAAPVTASGSRGRGRGRRAGGGCGSSPTPPGGLRTPGLLRQAQRSPSSGSGLAGDQPGGRRRRVWRGVARHALLAVLGLQAAPLLARGWADVQLVQLGRDVAGPWG